jgi:hypothetical protein
MNEVGEEYAEKSSFSLSPYIYPCHHSHSIIHSCISFKEWMME